MADSLKIGVLGGSFNPVHIGHLIMAQSVLSELGLDKVLFVTSTKNPFKIDKKELAFEVRMDLVKKAIMSNPKFEMEVFDTKDEISYTIDTVRYLKNKYENAQFYFICGVDNLMELHLWKDFEDLALLCEFAFVNRNELAYHYIEAQVEFLATSYEAKITEVKSPSIEISSTDIRDKIKEGKSIKYLVPDCIEEDVLKLYGDFFDNKSCVHEDIENVRADGEVRFFISDDMN